MLVIFMFLAVGFLIIVLMPIVFVAVGLLSFVLMGLVPLFFVGVFILGISRQRKPNHRHQDQDSDDHFF